MFKFIFLIVGLYMSAGVVIYIINLLKPAIKRPLCFNRGSSFYLNPLFIILFSPTTLLMYFFTNVNKNKQKYIKINASEDEKELYNHGTIANHKGDYKKAIEVFSRVIEINPNISEAYVNRGVAYSKLKNSDFSSSSYEERKNKAMLDFDKAILVDPKNGSAYSNRAIAKWIDGDFDGAVSDVAKSQELGFSDIDPNFENIIKGLS